MRDLIEKLRFLNDGYEIKLTASIGAAFCDVRYFHPTHAEFAMKAADMLLYVSKELGRNLVSAAAITKDTDLDQLRLKLLANADQRKTA